MSPGHPEVEEIDPAEFERELREESGIVVLDTRRRDDFAEWHVSPATGSVVNVPAEEIDPDAVAELGGSVRVICAAGNTSRLIAAALNKRGIDAVGVRGGMVAWSRVLRSAEVALAGSLQVIQFRREARGCLSYLLISDGEALVVDP